MADETSTHAFQSTAVFVGGGTCLPQVSIAVLAGKLHFKNSARIATGQPSAAPFEVHVKGSLGRRNHGVWGLPDPTGALSTALGLSPVIASTAEIRQWRRRVDVARVALAVVGLLNIAAAMVMLTEMVGSTPTVQVLLPPLFLALPTFGALFIALPYQEVGYLRRTCAMVAFGELFPFVLLATDGSMVSEALCSMALVLACGCWAILRPIPLLGRVP